MVGQSATPLFMHESVKKSGVKEDEPQLDRLERINRAGAPKMQQPV